MKTLFPHKRVIFLSLGLELLVFELLLRFVSVSIKFLSFYVAGILMALERKRSLSKVGVFVYNCGYSKLGLYLISFYVEQNLFVVVW